jgi:two-component system, cell cycle response regulator
MNVDHFKAINDHFGDAVGDKALAHLVRLCKDTTRTSDIIGRIGGDAFAVLLPETPLSEAAATAERLRRVVSDNPLPELLGKVALSVSIGVAEGDGDMPDAGALVKTANRALDLAKAAGGNILVLAEPEGSLPSAGRAELRPVH